MKIFRLILLISASIFVSCTTDDDSSIVYGANAFQIDEYYGTYALYGGSLIDNPNGDNLVKFEYDTDGRIVKKTGDLLHIGGGMGGYLSDLLYTDVTYNGNTVYLEDKVADNSYFTRMDHNVEYTYNSNGKIIQKINYQQEHPELTEFKIDTTYYTYQNGKMVSFIQTETETEDYISYYITRTVEAELFYTNGNLDSIVKTYSYKFSDWDYKIYKYKTVEEFSDYDNATNPFTGLTIFDETFTRSLSKNNFRYYTKTKYNYTYPNGIGNTAWQTGELRDEPAETSYKSWNFVYDADGEWVYDEF